MRELICRLRDMMGLGLVMAGLSTMTDECAVAVAEAASEAYDVVPGGGDDPGGPAIRPRPRGVW